MFLGLSLDAWITIATLVAVMAALLFTRLRSDVVFRVTCISACINRKS